MTVLGKPRQSGRGTHWWIALQVALSVGLAVVAVQLINYLVARPGIRVRFDTTAKETNSLDPAMTRVLEQLPEDENVTVDIFFRPVHPPLARLVSQVQDRTSQLLERMALVSAGRLRIRRNDMADFTAVQQRLLDLRLRGLENCVVVSKGEQREVVRLIDGLATFDPGNPNPDAYRPPAIRSFDAEINLLKGILSVTRGERPHVYFTTGHGEADPFEEGAETAGVLETALREDGFVIHTWNPAEDGDLPEDAFVVAVVGPIDPLGEATQNRLTRFLNDGGRLLVAPHADPRYLKSSGIAEWVKDWGLELTEGTVMEPFPDPSGSGALITGPRSVFFLVPPSDMNRQEILQPLLESGRSLVASRSHAIRVVRQPTVGTGLTMALFHSAKNLSWLDTVPLNYQNDAEVEPIRSYDLAAVSEFSVLDGEDVSEGTERQRSRLVVLGSADFLYSEILKTSGGGGSSLDFAKNAFNWLASREWRVNISPKDPDLRLLPAEAMPKVTRFVIWILPPVLLALGLLMAFLRSRGGPKSGTV